MIVVFGASGRVGTLVVERLRQQGYAPRCVSREPERTRATLGMGIDVVAGDADTPDSLAAAFTGARAECVFIATALHPRLAAQQCAIIDAATHACVRQIVKLSESDWTMQPGSLTTIGHAHAVVEAKLRALTIATASIRPSAFAQSFLAKAKAQASSSDRFTMPIGTAAVACVDMRDIADMLVGALENTAACRVGLAVHPITGPAAVTGVDIANNLSQHLGRSITYQPIAIDTALELERARGASRFMLDHLAQVYHLMAAGKAAQVTATINTWLGRRARPVDSFLKE